MGIMGSIWSIGTLGTVGTMGTMETGEKMKMGSRTYFPVPNKRVVWINV